MPNSSPAKTPGRRSTSFAGVFRWHGRLAYVFAIRNTWARRPCHFLLLFLLFVGCTPRITPPAAPSNPVRICVADYGRHASIVLPDQQGGLVEFAWGDYDFFARSHNDSGGGLAALFFSGGSALGVRHLPNTPPIAELQQTLSASRLLCFDVPADRAIALRTRLQSDIDEHALSMLYSAAHRMYFARNDEHYWAFHNCNHLTADWLRDLGCKVDGFVLFSNFEMATNPENPPPNR